MISEWSGEKITVSYISDEDLDDICNMLTKESVCRWLFFGPNTPEVTKAYFSPLIESVSTALQENRIPDSPVFTIRSKETGEFAGQCAILPGISLPEHILSATRSTIHFTAGVSEPRPVNFLYTMHSISLMPIS